MVSMALQIISAERELLSDDVEALVVPGIDGELAVLPNHAAFMTILKPGELLVRRNGVDSYFAVSGGFIEVMNNQVTVLADAAESSDEINEERAEAAIKMAKERLSMRSTDTDLSQVIGQIQRAEARLKVVRRRRTRSQL